MIGRRRAEGLRLPRHRGTTANLCTLYPWHTGPGPTRRGPYLGVNVTGGGTGWFYDPFELYGGVLTDSNVLVAGRPGRGKSAAVKTFLYREVGVYGRRRFVAINDPKGEYGQLAEHLGLTHFKLYPGGRNRLNPLDPAPGDGEDGGLLGRQTSRHRDARHRVGAPARSHRGGARGPVDRPLGRAQPPVRPC